MGTEDSGTIDAGDENLNVGFSTDKGVDCGGVERLEKLEVEEGGTSVKFGLELLFDVAIVSRIVGGDGDFKLLGEATKVLDEMDGKGTLGDVSAGLSGKFDALASKITQDDWVFLEDEGEE